MKTFFEYLNNFFVIRHQSKLNDGIKYEKTIILKPLYNLKITFTFPEIFFAPLKVPLRKQTVSSGKSKLHKTLQKCQNKIKMKRLDKTNTWSKVALEILKKVG